MKKLISILGAIVLTLSLIQSSQASDRGLGGLIIGGSSGALVGQAIGRNTEATIIGATVGGVLGLIVGSEIDRQHVTVNTYRHNTHYNRPAYNDRYQTHYYPPKRTCTETIQIRNGRHFEKRVIETVCRDRSRHNRHYNRPHRHGRYDR